MARLGLTLDVLRALFARSGNQCAFPGCAQPLVNAKNQFIGQVCHIEAAAPCGQRFNPGQSDEVRRSYDNLILLCYAHHVETNDVTEFTVERLKQIKQEHEVQFSGRAYKVAESVLRKLAPEMEAFWDQVERLNTLEHSMKDFAVPIDAHASFFEVLDACRDNVHYLQEFFQVFRESEGDRLRNWELHHIGVPNRMTHLQIDLLHLEIKYLEAYLQAHSEDRAARVRLDLRKDQFKELAQHSTLVD